MLNKFDEFKRFKLLLIVLLTGLLVAGFAACGNNDDDENDYVENGEVTPTPEVSGNDENVETGEGGTAAPVVVDPFAHVPAEGSTSLRVETMGNRQYDGAQISTEALGLEAGNVYEFSFEIFTPRTQENLEVGILLQTSNPWTHIVHTRVFSPGDSSAWHLYEGTLDLSNVQNVPGFIQFVKSNAGPNDTANTTFYIDNFTVSRDGEIIALFNFETGGVGHFTDSGSALVTTGVAVEPEITGTLVHQVTFSDASYALYSAHTIVGSQLSAERVTDFGQDDNYSLRLTNTTGNFTSGAGNYLRFNLPEPLAEGGTYTISWWVYIPRDRNPDKTTIPGGGININGIFGTPANQPTDATDLSSTTPMDQWVQVSTEFTLDHAVGEANFLIFRFRVNEPERQPTVWYIDNIEISVMGMAEVITPYWDLTLPSLAARWEDYFILGNILEPGVINNNPWGVVEMFLHHYNSVTAENAMKVDAISGGNQQATRPANLNLGGARTVVNFAQQHGLYMVGHTLVWHSQSAPWLYRDAATGEYLTRAEAMENMRWFIEQYAGYFEGRIDAWDVTNEVFTNGGAANTAAQGPEGSPVYDVGTWQRALRNYVPWYHAFANGADFDAGERAYDYIYYAFVFARRYAPSALLIYNDFNEESPHKRNAMTNMTIEINERWHADSVNNPAYGNPNHPDYGRLLIEVIGMQGHYNHNTNMDNIRDAIEMFTTTGARIHVTELDIHFMGVTPEPFVMSDVQLQRQATMFAQLFGWYREFADYIDRVTIWGREDGTSWRGTGAPTHFDRFHRAKPAFWAIYDPDGWQDRVN
ncbi:MAG: endo-1,4-beta-xylanase [Defluviitaleaceae bacterium]|nr:endo-1,4-beta-xylanase [Defluviitaleaceae bacterium]